MSIQPFPEITQTHIPQKTGDAKYNSDCSTNMDLQTALPPQIDTRDVPCRQDLPPLSLTSNSGLTMLPGIGPHIARLVELPALIHVSF